ncbi:amidohydrolase family protein [Mangrovicoccus ximenensis]|uniref:hypothetical protein n=1 Tax=Mangrovicoccus ximenensis TaxID=1911570 RepID=UPI00191C51F6
MALPGCTVLPGIIDLHGDGFERHLAPRRGLVSDLGRGLAALDAELAASGITTAVLAQFWSWEGGMRSPDFAKKLAVALEEARPHLLTDMVIQLRLETHLTDQFGEVAAFVERHGIGYVVYNDHLPHEALKKGRNPPRLTGQALKSGRSPEAHLALIRELAARDAEVPGALAELSRRSCGAAARLEIRQPVPAAARRRRKPDGGRRPRRGASAANHGRTGRARAADRLRRPWCVLPPRCAPSRAA